MECVILGIAAVCACFGGAIGSTKGRTVEGAVLGLLLGPIGLILIAVIPRTPESQAAFNRQVRVLERSSGGGNTTLLDDPTPQIAKQVVESRDKKASDAPVSELSKSQLEEALALARLRAAAIEQEIVRREELAAQQARERAAAEVERARLAAEAERLRGEVESLKTEKEFAAWRHREELLARQRDAAKKPAKPAKKPHGNPLSAFDEDPANALGQMFNNPPPA